MTKLKYAWMTDIHLNFLPIEKRFKFYTEIEALKPNGIFISGDIAEAPTITSIVAEMNEQLDMPIYFVLGNHDFYQSSRKKMFEEMRSLFKASVNPIQWLPAHPIYLNDETLLVGIDGWADARNGIKSRWLRMNDSVYIEELADAYNPYDLEPLYEEMQRLADMDADHLRFTIQDQMKESCKRVIVLTHVPPYPEVAVYRGKRSDPEYLTYYTSKATGEVLLELAERYPAVKFEVYCGHTHGAASYEAKDNLIVECGGAEYSHPKVQKLIEV